ncbi:unnamed protein product, partial [Rotaria magnacalcarata]
MIKMALIDLLEMIIIGVILRGLINFLEDSREAALDIFKNIIKVIDDHQLNIYNLTSIGAVLKDRLSHILKGNCYAHVLHNGVKHAHDVLKSDIQQAELNLQRTWTTAVDLYRIITNLMEKLEQRLNDKYFG